MRLQREKRNGNIIIGKNIWCEKKRHLQIFDHMICWNGIASGCFSIPYIGMNCIARERETKRECYLVESMRKNLIKIWQRFLYCFGINTMGYFFSHFVCIIQFVAADGIIWGYTENAIIVRTSMTWHIIMI